MKVVEAAKKYMSRLPFDIYINEYPTGDFNAISIPTGNGILCLFHTGLLRLLYLVSLSSAYMVSSSEEGITYIDPVKRPREESREYLSLCMTTQLIIDYLLHRNLNARVLQGYHHDTWGLIVAWSLSYSMKAFVIAHEIGHAILGHLQKGKTRRIPTSRGPITGISQSHKDEYEADLWAQSILLKSDKKGKALFGLSGGGLSFLIVYLMILHIRKKIMKYPDLPLSSTTHPSTTDRIKALDTYLESHYKDNSENELLAPTAMLWRVQDLIARSEIQITHDYLKVYPPDDIR